MLQNEKNDLGLWTILWLNMKQRTVIYAIWNFNIRNDYWTGQLKPTEGELKKQTTKINKGTSSQQTVLDYKTTFALIKFCLFRPVKVIIRDKYMKRKAVKYLYSRRAMTCRGL